MIKKITGIMLAVTVLLGGGTLTASAEGTTSTTPPLSTNKVVDPGTGGN